MLSQVAELDTEGRLRKSANPRIMLEALVLRFAHLSNTLELEAIVSGSAPVPPAPRGVASKPAHKPVAAERSPAQPAPAKEEARPSADAQNAQAAWRDLLEARTTLPQGMGILLKTAKVSEASPGTVTIEVPSGPASERLNADFAARKAIAKALSERLGRTVQLEIVTAGASAAAEKAEAPRRLTPELVKSEKLARMAKEDPVLGQAVNEWNLELLD